jgi:hypothetical protein
MLNVSAFPLLPSRARSRFDFGLSAFFRLLPTQPQNILSQMSEPAQATVSTPTASSDRSFKTKVLIIRIILVIAISLGLGFTHSWASTRYYGPDYVAGFGTGMMEGALMPAALPGLVGGKDLPIYAPNNLGRPYKIGYILGLNTCGTIFFGICFFQPRRKR